MNDRTGRTACSLEPGIRIPRPFWRGTKPGNSVAEKIPAKKWAIIKHARSGSNLFRQWNPGKTSQDKQGEEYVKLIQHQPLDYYLKGKEKLWFIHPKTKRDLEGLLRILNDHGEEVLISYIKNVYLKKDKALERV